MDIINQIRQNLFLLQDRVYQKFHSRLMPNINFANVIGVRVPHLKKYAKTLSKTKNVQVFLDDLPHKFYEENNLHAFVLCEENNFETCIQKLNIFLPYVDNWATCDSLRPKCFKQNKVLLLAQIKKWLSSQHPFVQRFGIEMLMVHFLDDDFCSEILQIVESVRSEEYYVNMMIAWFLATALAKKWQQTIGLIEKQSLSVFVHNKTIQKAVESLRISPDKKDYLKKFRIKEDKNKLYRE